MIVADTPPRPSVTDLMRVHETKLRFLLAGGLNTLFGLAIFPVLIWLFAPLSVHYMVALTIAQIMGVVFAFLTNKLLVFKTRGQHVREFGKFVTFYAVGFVANLIALPILVELAHVPPIWAQLMFVSMLIISSYFWHSRITFASSGVIDP
jgi:putative flippase GtrA